MSSMVNLGGRRRRISARSANLFVFTLVLGMLGATLLPTLAEARAPKSRRAAARAPSAPELLAEAKVLFDNHEITGAESRLDQAEALGGLNKRLKIELYEYLGVVRLKLGNLRSAKAAFRKLIKLEPAHQISRRIAKPDVVLFFDTFRRSELRETRADIKHTPPKNFGFGEAMRLSAYVIDHTGTVAGLSVYFRKHGSSEDYSSAKLVAEAQDPAHYLGTIPFIFGDQPKPFQVDYYLAAVNRADEWVATKGSAIKAMHFQSEGGVAPEIKVASKSVFSRWWFWTGVGVLVAGAAGGGVLGFRSTHPLPDTGAAILVIR